MELAAFDADSLRGVKMVGKKVDAEENALHDLRIESCNGIALRDLPYSEAKAIIKKQGVPLTLTFAAAEPSLGTSSDDTMLVIETTPNIIFALHHAC